MAEPARVTGDAPSRLELARGLLCRMEDRAQTMRPTAAPDTGDRSLPVAEPLAGLLPGGGLRRGSVVALAPEAGSISLLFALLAKASAGGAWAGVVGSPGLGLVAAAEAGVQLERLALVPDPGRELVAITAALLDGLDLVAVSGVGRGGMGAADRQRLAARARQRGAVLVSLGGWPGADVELGCVHARWQGLSTGGSGRLSARRVCVRLRGRGVRPGGCSARMLLPGPCGQVGPAPGVHPVDQGVGERQQPAGIREAG